MALLQNNMKAKNSIKKKKNQSKVEPLHTGSLYKLQIRIDNLFLFIFGFFRNFKLYSWREYYQRHLPPQIGKCLKEISMCNCSSWDQDFTLFSHNDKNIFILEYFAMNSCCSDIPLKVFLDYESDDNSPQKFSLLLSGKCFRYLKSMKAWKT